MKDSPEARGTLLRSKIWVEVSQAKTVKTHERRHKVEVARNTSFLTFI